MNVSMTFIRMIFFVLCALLATIYTLTFYENFSWMTFSFSIICSAILTTALYGVEIVFRQFNLRTFNIAIIGMFFGYLLSQATVTIIFGIIDLNATPLDSSTEGMIKALIYLSTIYLGMTMTGHAADELYLSIPFVKFNATALKKKDLILDGSILFDQRIIDLASSGLLDHHLILPRFVLSDLQSQADRGDEMSRNKARKGLEVAKKLESLPFLDMRINEHDFPEIKDPLDKILKLAKILDANIITADIGQVQLSKIDDVKIIKFPQLCNTLKPLSQSGELINIKIQRNGKEPRQGIGYLDDGTMVVVNGGADYITKSIKAQVLSVKHTSSGRMIFCNALEESLLEGGEFESNNLNNSICQEEEFETIPSKYFTL